MNQTQQTDGVKLTKLQYEVLCEMPSDSEFCIGYVHLTQIGDRDTLRPVIKQLRDMGFVEYLRGLMTEDGEVAGSGFCRVYKKNDEIKRLIEEYEKQPEQKTYTQQELDQAISQAKEEERKRVVQEIIDNNGFVAVGSKDGREVEYELVKEYL